MRRRLAEWHLSVYGYRCGDIGQGETVLSSLPLPILSLSLSFAGTLRESLSDVLSGRGPSLGQHHDRPPLSTLYDNNSITLNVYTLYADLFCIHLYY